LLANIIIVPLGATALASAMGSLLCGAWLPVASEVLNNGARFWMSLMIRVSHWAASLPGAFVWVASPPLWFFPVFYGFVLAVMGGNLLGANARKWLGMSCVAAGLILGLHDWTSTRSAVKLSVLPLAGGHAVFADLPGSKRDLLVDCGNTNSFESVLKTYLHSQGVNRIKAMALTHGDLQHIGAAPLCIAEFKPGQILASGFRFRSAKYRAIVAELACRTNLYRKLDVNDQCGPFTVLHPDAGDEFGQADDASLVLLGNFHQTRVLLLGDLGRLGQQALLARHPDLRADVVVSGLPDKSDAISRSLLDALRPRLIVVADSEYPATKRAPLELQHRLRDYGAPVIYTREAGGMQILITSTGWRIATANSQ